MIYKHNKLLLPVAKELRKNTTREENHLWYDFLSFYPVRFIRQKILGRYVADFYCPKAKLVIEVDGEAHNSEQAQQYDKERTDFLSKEYGITVIRVSNSEVMKDFKLVCSYIDFEVKRKIEQLKI